MCKKKVPSLGFAWFIYRLDIIHMLDEAIRKRDFLK
jgi:hypothetical protein